MHLSSAWPWVARKDGTRPLPLSWAPLAAVPYVNTAAFGYSSMVRLHAVFGLQLFSFPFQANDVFADRSLVILKTCPIHLHVLLNVMGTNILLFDGV